MPRARSTSLFRPRSCGRPRTASETPMEIVRERSGDVVQLRLSGRLDNHWSQSLDETLDDLAREGALHLLLDFPPVTYPSPARLAVLPKPPPHAPALPRSFPLSHPPHP